MKTTHFKKAICAVLAVGMLELSGCGRQGYICNDRDVLVGNSVTERDDVQSQAVQNENGSVIAVEYVESGGEDGRVNLWCVYREDERYILAFSDRFSTEPEIFEISEEDYRSVMSFDYPRAAAEYEKNKDVIICDGVNFELTLTYENGEQHSGRAELYELNNELYAMLEKYRKSSSSDITGDSAIEVHFIESGGDDGRSIDRAVYKDGDRYVFAYTERHSQPPEVFEISEEEYNEIMSLDYEKAIAKYEATSHEIIYDGIYYSVRVVCANGEELSGEVDRGKLTKKFAHLYKKYIGDAEIDY